MATINASDLGGDWRRLLEQLKRGERLTITRDGKTEVMLAPVGNEATGPAVDQGKIDAAFEYVRNFKPQRPVTDAEIREMINEGRRF